MLLLWLNNIITSEQASHMCRLMHLILLVRLPLLIRNDNLFVWISCNKCTRRFAGVLWFLWLLWIIIYFCVDFYTVFTRKWQDVKNLCRPLNQTYHFNRFYTLNVTKTHPPNFKVDPNQSTRLSLNCHSTKKRWQIFIYRPR